MLSKRNDNFGRRLENCVQDLMLRMVKGSCTLFFDYVDKQRAAAQEVEAKPEEANTDMS